MSQGAAAPDRRIYVGRAGWSLSRSDQAHFPPGSSHLARYAQRFPAVEINSSFYRPHRVSTYARWAASVPGDFRFSVKLPKAITHERRLIETDAPLDRFFSEVHGLGSRLGCLLVQLPPSLIFDQSVASAFLTTLRRRFDGFVALEPRHASWFSGDADQLLIASRIGRVAADPPRVGLAPCPGGWPGVVYYRLHGSPTMYYSPYDDDYLAALATQLSASLDSGAALWCVFDNTARGAATENALTLQRALSTPRAMREASPSRIPAAPA